MMPWTHFPLAEGDDWQHVEVINEFMLGIRERVDAAGYPLQNDQQTEYWSALNGADSRITDYEAGDGRDLQWRLIYQQIQDLIERIVPWFINPANFDITDIDPFADTSDLFEKIKLTDWFYSWSDVRTLAGIPAGGWTRKYPFEISAVGDMGEDGQRARLLTDTKIYDHTDGAWVLSADQASRVDVIEGAGQMEGADYIGPWIFNEIVSVLDLLKHRVYCAQREINFDGTWAKAGPMSPGTSELTYISTPQPTGFGGRYGDDTDNGSFATARAQAETEYDASENAHNGYSYATYAEIRYNTGSSNPYQAYLAGTDFGHYIIFGNYDYPNSFGQDTSQIQIDFETYVYAHTPVNTTTGTWDWSFNAFNSGVVQDQWAMIGSGTAYHRDLSQVGDHWVAIIPRPGTSDTKPAWPADPPLIRGGVLEGFTWGDNETGQLNISRGPLMVTYAELIYTSNP